MECLVGKLHSKRMDKNIFLVGNRVVTSGENAKEVWKTAKAKYPDKTPSLAKAPKEEIFDVRVAWALIEDVPPLLGRMDVI
jgi:hypothetical protein